MKKILAVVFCVGVVLFANVVIANTLEFTPLSRPADEFSWKSINKMVLSFSSPEVNIFGVGVLPPGYIDILGLTPTEYSDNYRHLYTNNDIDVLILFEILQGSVDLDPIFDHENTIFYDNLGAPIPLNISFRSGFTDIPANSLTVYNGMYGLPNPELPTALFYEFSLQAGTYFPNSFKIPTTEYYSPFNSIFNISTGIALPDPVPEPTTMLLLGTGLVGVAGAARRRKRQ